MTVEELINELLKIEDNAKSTSHILMVHKKMGNP